MSVFRVALSGDFRRADGTPTFPDFDLSPLTDHPQAELKWVDPVDGVIPAAAQPARMSATAAASAA